MCDLDGEILAAVSRQRIKVKKRRSRERASPSGDPRVLDASAAIAKALGAIGPITVQCMMKNDTPYFTEVNARLGGGFPLGLAAGADSLRWLLAKTAGLPATIPPAGRGPHRSLHDALRPLVLPHRSGVRNLCKRHQHKRLRTPPPLPWLIKEAPTALVNASRDSLEGHSAGRQPMGTPSRRIEPGACTGKRARCQRWNCAAAREARLRRRVLMTAAKHEAYH